MTAAQHNQCVGVISPPLGEIIRNELDTELPYELIRRRIFAYRLHGALEEIFLIGDEKEGPTYTLQRANFDAFMLKRAMSLGVEVVEIGPLQRIAIGPCRNSPCILKHALGVRSPGRPIYLHLDGEAAHAKSADAIFMTGLGRGLPCSVHNHDYMWTEHSVHNLLNFRQSSGKVLLVAY